MFLEARKSAIPRAQWIVTIQLEVERGTGRENTDAKNTSDMEGARRKVQNENVGEPLVLQYGDSYLAKDPRNVGYLIASAMNERATRLKSAAKKKGNG